MILQNSHKTDNHFQVQVQVQVSINSFQMLMHKHLNTVQPRSNETQALILSPTRELAQHTQKVIIALGDFMNIQ